MAAGPFVGAWIIGGIHPSAALDGAGIPDGPLRNALEAPWRYVFYINVPIGIAALGLAWPAAHGWETPRRAGRLDVAGAAAFSLALGLALLATTLAGSERIGDLSVDPGTVIAGLAVAAALAGALGIRLAFRHPAPFLDLHLFRSAAFSSAALVSLLTGYGLATAIVGGAVFVDRVLYGGPDVQRVALGALAGATALGALGSGLALRAAGIRLVTVAGLVLSTLALVRMAAWTPATELAEVAAWMAAFGLGFGLTVTPRSTAAVEALGHAAFGVASATVTVARMVGMAAGLASLTAFGSTTIDRVSREVYATPESYRQFIPETLRDRPLHDGLVVQALEEWASGEAARILVGIFLVAAVITAAALIPALALGRRRILEADAVLEEPAAGMEPGGVA
jgi:MFS family permease